MNKLHEQLDVAVSNFGVLFVKLHHYHWYVEGRQFFTWHEHLEGWYDKVNELFDEFAERLIQIGGQPTATLKGYLAKTTLKEVEGIVGDVAVILKDVKADFKTLVAHLKLITKLAQEVEDEVTADLCIGTLADLEKTLWMINASSK